PSFPTRRSSDLVGHLPDLLGIRMRGDVRVVRADAEDREVHAADVAEALVIGGVSAVEDFSLAVGEDISVEAAMRIVKDSRTPVLDATGADIDAAKADRLAPLQFGHVAEFQI